MRMPLPTLALCIALLTIMDAADAPAATGPAPSAAENLIPKPASVKPGQGKFVVGQRTRIVCSAADSDLLPSANALARTLRTATGFPLPLEQSVRPQTKDAIVFSIARTGGLGTEGYELTVTPGTVEIEAGRGAGAFYGVQTLLQLLPPQVFSQKSARGTKWEIPAVQITDRPRFGWRGMMLDVSRHFFPKEVVKEFIDELARHKMNIFHWHLTDDQGWRIEIKRYPQLTALSAWRVDRENIAWSARPPALPGEVATCGGYYTQDEIREIVRYAADRYITVVPEIEMPAHATAVLAAFPELSCTGGPFTVPTGGLWPIKDIYCGGNDSVFTFLENVLTEVTGLFPGQYIHIGGDEADKTEWKRCPRCQERIKKESLGGEAALQSYFVKRIEKFLVARGKRLIGWDEILEGGLAPEATVMSWRGTNGGIEAAKSGHDVIMSPTSHCYFDYCQGDWTQEPISWGGYIPLSKVYSFEPTPAELTADEARHVLGAQGNLWSEVIPDRWKIQYMAFPRIAAMSELTWSPAGSRDWENFAGRLGKQLARYDARGVTYSPAAWAVAVQDSFDTASWTRIVTLRAEIGQERIRYTLDGKSPGPRSAPYTGPIVVRKGATLNAAVIREDGQAGPIVTRQLHVSPRGLKVPVLALPLDLLRNGSGPQALVDNIRASGGPRDTGWQGLKEKDLDAVIDLGGERSVKRVTAGFYHSSVELIFPPESLEIALSEDGKNFHTAATIMNDYSPMNEKPAIRDFSATLSGSNARYIRIHAKSLGKCPAWHKRAGEPVWIYVDEIFVE